MEDTEAAFATQIASRGLKADMHGQRVSEALLAGAAFSRADAGADPRLLSVPIACPNEREADR